MEKLIEFPKRKLLGNFSIRDDGNGSEKRHVQNEFAIYYWFQLKF